MLDVTHKQDLLVQAYHTVADETSAPAKTVQTRPTLASFRSKHQIMPFSDIMLWWCHAQRGLQCYSFWLIRIAHKISMKPLRVHKRAKVCVRVCRRTCWMKPREYVRPHIHRSTHWRHCCLSWAEPSILVSVQSDILLCYTSPVCHWSIPGLRLKLLSIYQ